MYIVFSWRLLFVNRMKRVKWILTNNIQANAPAEYVQVSCPSIDEDVAFDPRDAIAW